MLQDESTRDSNAVHKAINQLTSTGDDVHSNEFLRTIIVQIPRDQKLARDDYKITISTIDGVLSSNVVHVHISSDKQDDALHSGPYFLLGNTLHQAWRLYPDSLDAFVITVLPDATTNSTRFVPRTQIWMELLTKI